jgi:hypothetical protein
LHQAQTATRNGNSLCNGAIINAWVVISERPWFVHNNFARIKAIRAKETVTDRQPPGTLEAFARNFLSRINAWLADGGNYTHNGNSPLLLAINLKKW